MGNIDYKAIYEENQDDWKGLTRNPQKYESLLAGHYSDSNHFVYELLQNAEDAFETNEDGIFDPITCVHADKVVIEYYHDKLVFYHNGKPFDEGDVRGVSSMLMGTKDKDDAQTIGRFGMGFKSVFKYTYQPEIYSDKEAFKITRYLLPVEIEEGWDYNAEKKSVICKLGHNRSYVPFANEQHLTKIVIPFLKYGKDGGLQKLSGEDVLKKLNSLNGEILLFLTHIHHLYWVNKENGKYARITVDPDETDSHIVTCRIESSESGGKEDITRYLKFKRVFDHPDMENAEVSVAYKLNNRADNINEIKNSVVWVYFPTRDETDLPFLVHGSFETAVSREKLMTPSDFNDDLFDELGDLIAESMEELGRRKLITIGFLRNIMLKAFEDEEENETIPGLKEKVTEVLKDKGLLPDRKGVYRHPEEMLIPVPFRIGEFSDKPLFNTIIGDTLFVALNNEREQKFTEYFDWLVNDLGIKQYRLSDFARDLKTLICDRVSSTGQVIEAIKDFYEFLQDNRESVYETNLTYTRSGSYGIAIKQDINKAWELLRQAPIILNRAYQLVPAERNGKPAVYLGTSSDYKSMSQSELVNSGMSHDYKLLFVDGFNLQEFNNFQYIKEKVIQKYIDIDENIEFNDSENYTEEYVEDLKQIFAFIDETGNANEIKELLDEAYIVKIKSDGEDSSGTFARPKECYVPVSSEGIDLDVYYAPVLDSNIDEDEYDDPDSWYGFKVYPIDKDYYDKNSISINKLAKLGLISSPVDDGDTFNNGSGDNYWFAMGDFCPNIKIDGIEDNLEFIEEYPDLEIAKKKSAEILKLLLSISGKLKGKKRKRKTNPYLGSMEEVYLLRETIKKTEWIYDRNMMVHCPGELSKHDLNPALYGHPIDNKAAYEILGFVEKEADEAEDTLQKVSNLNRQDKRRLLDSLAKDLGLEISERASADDDWDDEEGGTFNPYAFQDDEFPVRRVHNIDYLIRHVQEQFYCADPTRYERVWRQIRVSKNAKADRAYAIGMYTNTGNVTLCQMCKSPIAFPEVCQISNYGIEMPQINLCLCKNCAARYKSLRDVNRDKFKMQMRSAILSLDAGEYADEYSIDLGSDAELYFTQTHVAEIQEIFRLLDEYGTPSVTSDDAYEEETGGPLMHPGYKPESNLPKASANISESDITASIVDEVDAKAEGKAFADTKSPDVATEGYFITFKKRYGNRDICEVVLEPKKFPLHKALQGHKVGDVVKHAGQEVEIIGIG